METAGDPSARLGVLVEALSEMAKPLGYVVEVLKGAGMMPALGIRKPGGEWLASMCTVVVFPGGESAAEALVLKYGSKPEWNAHFYADGKILRFPGGSPEELALKAAAGVCAVLVSQ